jgi:putative Ca2+/H+ antiporter (TMEM165/GDT1 family)
LDNEFFLVLLEIILINIVLSGDNAVVIALACRNLDAKYQKKAVFLGSFGAIALRIVLTFLAVYLLTIPYLNFVGGILLLWIAIKLLKGEDEEEFTWSYQNDYFCRFNHELRQCCGSSWSSTWEHGLNHSGLSDQYPINYLGKSAFNDHNGQVSNHRHIRGWIARLYSRRNDIK